MSSADALILRINFVFSLPQDVTEKTRYPCIIQGCRAVLFFLFHLFGFGFKDYREQIPEYHRADNP